MQLVYFVLSLIGFVLICSAMDRHSREIHGGELSAPLPTVLRSLGALALLASMAGWMARLGPAVGFAIWCAGLTFAALLAAAVNTHRPHWLGARSQAAPR